MKTNEITPDDILKDFFRLYERETLHELEKMFIEIFYAGVYKTDLAATWPKEKKELADDLLDYFRGIFEFSRENYRFVRPNTGESIQPVLRQKDESEDDYYRRYWEENTVIQGGFYQTYLDSK